MGCPADDCKNCPLHEGRTQAVWHRGNQFGAICFIGEAPGAEEDKQGKPFVGRSGQLLDKVLLKAKDFAPDVPIGPTEVLIVNAVKCRPPDNRTPTPEERNACRPFLDQQLALAKPKLIVLLGRSAMAAVLPGDLKEALAAYRGRVHPVFFGKDLVAPAVITYHPAAVLRSSKEYGALMAEDLKLAISTWRSLTS